MLVPMFCITVPFFTSVTVTGVTVVLVVMVAVPAMPGFSSLHRQLLSVDVEAEVGGHRQFPRAFRQLHHELIAIHRDDLELLRLATSSSDVCANGNDGRQAHKRTH